MRNQAALRCQITAVLVGEHCWPARLDLHYDPAEGYAVVLTIRPGAGDLAAPALWRLDRQLLQDGLTAAAGAGDVRVRPLSGDWTMIDLGGPAAAEILVLASADLRMFLAETLRLVPHGEEAYAVDWDEAARSLGA